VSNTLSSNGRHKSKKSNKNKDSKTDRRSEIYRVLSRKKSKPIIDEIDRVLAKHYGFSEEELDFVINYDIKYRMSGELEDAGVKGKEL
jgi:hypothetical protein